MLSNISKYLLSILKVAHEEQRDPGDAFKRAAIGFYLAHHLKLAGFFPPDYMTEATASDSSESSKDGFFSVKNQTVVTIVTLLVRHLQSCSCNAYEIDELVRDRKGMSANRNERLGGAVYPTVSLSNHSCVPNTIRYFFSFHHYFYSIGRLIF